MSPRLDTPLDRREAVSALLVTLAAVMGLGALPEPVNAEELPSLEYMDCYGQPRPTKALHIAMCAGLFGGDDDAETARLLREAAWIHQQYGVQGALDQASAISKRRVALEAAATT